MGLKSALGKVTGHTVHVHSSEHHVRVLVGGEVVADTHLPLVLQETGYPDRFYIPAADVRADLLRPSDKRSHCPFKGDASYVGVEAGGVSVENAAWTYAEPIEAVAPIAGHLSFYPGGEVVVEVDGAPLA